MSKVFELSLGPLADDLSVQLTYQGFHLKAETAKMLQKDADAISRLVVHGLITDSMGTSARKKLMRQIQKAMKP